MTNADSVPGNPVTLIATIDGLDPGTSYSIIVQQVENSANASELDSGPAAQPFCTSKTL